MKTHIVFVIIVALCGFGCTRLKQGGNGKCEGNSLGDYVFDLPITISPANDTLHLGDTIWVEQDFSENMVNLQNGKTYPVKDFDFGMYFRIENIGVDTSYAISSWQVVPKIGSAISGNGGFGQSCQIKHEYNNGRYQIKFGVVVHETGVFATWLDTDYRYDPLAAYGQHITDCRPEYLLLYFNTNNKAENGYHLYQASPDSRVSTLPRENYDYGGHFSFVVLP